MSGGQRALLLDDDLRVVLGECEDDILGFLPEFQLLVRIETLEVYTDTGGLCSVGEHAAGHELISNVPWLQDEEGMWLL